MALSGAAIAGAAYAVGVACQAVMPGDAGWVMIRNSSEKEVKIATYDKGDVIQAASYAYVTLPPGEQITVCATEGMGRKECRAFYVHLYDRDDNLKTDKRHAGNGYGYLVKTGMLYIVDKNFHLNPSTSGMPAPV